MSYNDSPNKHLKKSFYNRSPTVEQLREDIRKQFHEKLKINRGKELGRRRDLIKDVINNVYHQFNKIKEELLDGAEEITSEEMSQFLIEVEEELCTNFNQQQADEYTLDLETRTSLNAFCGICNNIIKSDILLSFMICDTCAGLYFNSNSL